MILSWAMVLARAGTPDAGAQLVLADGHVLRPHRVQVSAEVGPELAAIEVAQWFRTPGECLDATYLFPLPPEATVRAMSLWCGDRREQHVEDSAALPWSVDWSCPAGEVLVRVQYDHPLSESYGRTLLALPSLVQGAQEVDIGVTLPAERARGFVVSDTHEIVVERGAPGLLWVRTVPEAGSASRVFRLSWGAQRPSMGAGAGGYGQGPDLLRRPRPISWAGGDPIILGALSQEQIVSVVDRREQEIRACFDGESGKVVIKFKVGKDGAVSQSEVKASTVPDAVGGCLAVLFRGMRFPPPEGGGIAIVSYPILRSTGE